MRPDIEHDAGKGRVAALDDGHVLHDRTETRLQLLLDAVVLSINDCGCFVLFCKNIYKRKHD